jgi:site-specific recombinase XerD
MRVAAIAAAEKPRHDLTVHELLVRFQAHADQYYRGPGGKVTSEYHVYSRAVRELRQLYGHESAAGFDQLKLEAVRQQMIANDVSREVINGFVGRIRSVFKWGASKKLVPSSIVVDLGTLAGLKKGRTTARECEDVTPVPDIYVDAILPYVGRSVRGMVELQRVTGARPGEICSLRLCDVDMTADVWIYKPHRHKNTWRGKSRTVAIGPRGQAIIKQFMSADVGLDLPLFSPKRDRLERAAGKRVDRRDRRKPNAKPRPGLAYTKDSFARAVVRGIDKANAARRAAATAEGRKIGEHELVPHWSPNRIRHRFATTVRAQFGIESASAMLGHTELRTTEIYAARNLDAAKRVAAAVG